MMIYTFGIFLYEMMITLAAPFNKKARARIRGSLNAFRILHQKVDPTQEYVWFHAASLGEFEQGRPLMERMRREHPEYKILLTFFSPSGYEVRKDYEGADIVCYLPFDTPSSARIFLKLVQPKMAFFIKYEFWMNILHACYKHHIPVYSVSSIFRKNKVFFRWYGARYAKVLQYISHFFVQDELSRRLLATLNIKGNVTVVGDTRFDRVIDIANQAMKLPIVDAMVKNAGYTLVAGSTWSPDEDIIIPYFNTHPKMKLLIAPHVIKEDHLQQIEEKIQRPFVRYSKATVEQAESADCIIVDCFGLLSSMYRHGDIAYVGGGFGAGIHNVPEAAVHGIPVLFGPKNQGFREAQDMLRLRCCMEITGRPLFNVVMDRLVHNVQRRHLKGRICREYITSNAGATAQIFSTLKL